MSELKAGDQIDFTAGGKTLRVEPVPYGNVKKILRIVMDMTRSADFSDIAALLDKYLDQMIPLLFKKAGNEFLTKEWAEDNLDVPTMKKILEAAIVVNGLKDFFDKAAKGTPTLAAIPLPNETPATPTESTGSTTSVEQPTAGSHAK